MGILAFLRRKKKTETAEERRSRLLTHGRITDGIIIDIEANDDGEAVAQYSYSVHGAEFESSDILTNEQVADGLRYAPGASVAIRFDQNNHGNSVIV
ncbi:MAG: hypothetical protein HKN33_13845 [Pyrinomonadaceae bacterium]|nr:hypothetical protein [Pyrinomonadaceae bacterium]